MQRLLELKQRMKTIRNIQNVTRTLATVSSAKLSRARGRAAGIRLYADRTRDALHRQQAYLACDGRELGSLSPYLTPVKDVHAVLLLHITGDRGMCGNYNLAVDRRALKLIEHERAAGRKVTAVCKGLKGRRYLERKGLARVTYAEPWSRVGVTDEDVDRFFELVSAPFLRGEVQEVYATYTEYHTPLKRIPRAVRLLPLQATRQLPTATTRWCYEPDLDEAALELVDMFVRCQIEEVLVQSYASEQGARMITMEEATERAATALHDSQVLYNRLRREVITTDLLGVLFASHLREEEAVASREGV